jgi:hypothetical protein
LNAIQEATAKNCFPAALVIKRVFLALEKNGEKKFYFFFIEQIVLKKIIFQTISSLTSILTFFSSRPTNFIPAASSFGTVGVF